MTAHDQEGTAQGVSRRDVMRRGAVLGGAMVWATPVVQTMTRPAFAQEGTPVDNGTISYVAVIFMDADGDRWRFKLDNVGDDGGCNLVWGRSFRVTSFSEGTCANAEVVETGNENVEDGDHPDGVTVVTCTPAGVTLELPAGSDAEEVAVKGGQCCALLTNQGATINVTDDVLDPCPG